MCRLWWSVPSVLVVGVGWCATVPAVRVWGGLPVDGEPVGCAACGLVAVVSSLGAGCRSVSLWGCVAVVSTLDTLPAVRVCRGGVGW